MMQRDFLLEAIRELSNGVDFILSDRDIDNIQWMSNNFNPPTKEQILIKKEEIEERYSLEEYKELRRIEYPDFREYLDGIVKGDQDQINSYIAKCLAVKEKYPKPV